MAMSMWNFPRVERDEVRIDAVVERQRIEESRMESMVIEVQKSARAALSMEAQTNDSEDTSVGSDAILW
jgi:hypothetical protein